ncbi:MAG: hypothetical protein LUQ65_14365, partial [Candidatus Helarchaeota archaeon]|nr:hypothetical protein [Candidatus Helarchaeota archaeon]
MFTQQTKPKVKFYVILSITLPLIGFILGFSSPSEAGKPTTFWVTEKSGVGWGSLPWALEAANANPGRDFIKFRVSGTILIETVLNFTDQSGVVLNGFSAPQPGITLEVNGGTLLVMSSNNVIQG